MMVRLKMGNKSKFLQNYSQLKKHSDCIFCSFLLLLIYVFYLKYSFHDSRMLFRTNSETHAVSTVDRAYIRSNFNIIKHRYQKEIRVAVCITGQKERLELRSKIRHLFKNNLQVTFDVFLVLSNETARFTNRVFFAGASNRDLKDVDFELSQLLSFVSSIEYVTHIEPKNPLLNQDFVTHFDKRASEKARKVRATNDVRQYLKLQICYNQIEKREIALKMQYDLLLRVRDDLYFLKDFSINEFIETKYDKRIATTFCDAWGGINDKIAVISRSAGPAYFNAPILYQYFYSDKTNWTRIYSSETFLKAVMKAENVTVYRHHSSVFPIAPSLKSRNDYKNCLKLYESSFACLTTGLPELTQLIDRMRCMTTKDISKRKAISALIK